MTQYNKKAKIQQFMHYLLLIILTLFILIPFILGFWTSLLPTADISKGALWSSHISLDNYVTAVTQTPIIRYLFNSLIISIITMLAQIIFCSLSAYSFVFLKFKGRDLLFYVFLATMMLPFEAEVIPNFTTVRTLGLLNHYAVMIVPF